MDKTIIKLTKEESILIQNASEVCMGNGDIYYHIPYFFKKEGKNEYGLIHPDQISKEVEDMFNKIGKKT